MKREEALKRVEGYLTDDFPPEEFDEVEEIMSALKQEPCDDCIARQPLIDKWNSCADMLMHEGDSEIIMDWIFDAPSVTPTRKKGKWAKFDPICPCCGENKYKDLDADVYTDWRPRYCPNCGAEMEVE